jgi:hypothetical protein
MRMMGRSRRVLLAAAGLLLATALPAQAGQFSEADRTGGPYVPTPQVVVDEMLRMAGVGPNDFVVDLGSGDGVIVLTAAKQFKARGFGVDIDPGLVKQSNGTAKRLGVADRASFEVRDVFKTDLSRATVLTLYLLPSMMNQLQSKVFEELRPGARVVSHDYQFGEWHPDDYVSFHVAEKERVTGVPRATIYLWIVPARVEGRWQLQIENAGREAYEIDVKQRFQLIEGNAHAGARSAKLVSPELRGGTIRFAFAAGTGRHVFSGRVSGNIMKGTVELGSGRGTARWSARRVAPRTSALN